MRTLIIIIVIIAILAGGSAASYRYIQTTTNSLGTQIDTVERYASAQKWEVAQKELSSAQQKWEKTKPWWTVLLNHQDIDNIDVSISRLEKYLAAQDFSLALGEVTSLKLQINQIHDAEKLNLENIL